MISFYEKLTKYSRHLSGVNHAMNDLSVNTFHDIIESAMHSCCSFTLTETSIFFCAFIIRISKTRNLLEITFYSVPSLYKTLITNLQSPTFTFSFIFDQVPLSHVILFELFSNLKFFLALILLYLRG